MRSIARRPPQLAFTLVELLVSMTVLGILLILLTQLTGSLRSVITQTTSSIEAFRDARDAFETMTRRIGQATLNSYEDLNPTVVNSSGASTATSYVRASELRFISGDAGTLISGSTYPGSAYPTDGIFFQAPLGFTISQSAALNQILNTCGYFIQWGSDQNSRPSFIPASVPYRWRFRLMELLEPSENLSIYNYTSGATTFPAGNTGSKSWLYTSQTGAPNSGGSGKEWFYTAVTTERPSPVRVLAENVVFLAILPIVAPQNAQSPSGGALDGTSTDIAPHYTYDTSPNINNATPLYSQNQLPPLVYVMMIAVDEPSFARYQAGAGTAIPTNLGLGGILTQADYTSRQNDVKQVTAALTSAKISYRIFSMAIPLSAH